MSGPLSSNVKSDRTLWIAVFALLCAGVVMVYSSSFIFAQERYKDGLYFFKRHVLFSAIGVVAFLFGWKFPVWRLKKLAFPLLGVGALMLIGTFIPGLGHKAGGASRWLNFGPFGFQPAEIVKFIVILYVAAQLQRKLTLRASREENWRSGFLTYFIGALPLYVLLLLQPDFGSTVLLACTTFCMLLACGVKLRYLITTVFVLIPSGAALIFTSTYRKNRFLGFLDPWSDPAHKGFQVIQSFLAFFSGKWFGVGLGNSREKLFYLPEAHNDFIFSVVGEELGLFGVLFFVGLFLVILLRGLTAASRLRHMDQTFECGLATGISTLIGLQAFFNMAVVLGLLPTKGLPLPLISYGGTSLIMMLFMLGLLSQLLDESTGERAS